MSTSLGARVRFVKVSAASSEMNHVPDCGLAIAHVSIDEPVSEMQSNPDGGTGAEPKRTMRSASPSAPFVANSRTFPTPAPGATSKVKRRADPPASPSPETG